MKYTHKRSVISIAMAALVLVSLCAVYASTSVSAADSSGSKAQPSAALVGAPLAGAPAVCVQDKSTVDLFAKGQDGALWYKQLNRPTGSWSAWMSLGGKLTSDPAAAALSPLADSAGPVDVFARGGDGALWARNTVDGGATWSNWYKIGGQLLAGTGPAAYGSVFAFDNRVGWFVIGMDHALWHAWNDNTGTHNWENLGGYLTSSPAATVGDSSQLDVFARGVNGALWTREFQTTTWTAWLSLGGQIAPGTGPAACAPGGIGHVFVQGIDGALWYRTGFDGLENWINWQTAGGHLTASPAAAVQGGGGWIASHDMFVFARGGDNNLWERTGVGFPDDTWASWTGPMAGPP